MDVSQCRGAVAAAILLTAGSYLCLSATECWSAEPNVALPGVPLIVPTDAPQSEPEPTLPILRGPSLTAELDILRPIPEHSRHWRTETDSPAQLDTLILPAEFQPWDWQGEYMQPDQPRKLQIDQAKTCSDCDLAKLQDEFKELLECGLLEEANRVLKRLQASGDTPKNDLMRFDLALHDARYKKSLAQRPNHHVTNYEPDTYEPRLYRQTYNSRADLRDWQTVSSSGISFHFRGATIGEVAAFFHHATGMPVRLELSADEPEFAEGNIHIRCRNKSVEQGLRVVLGSRGLGYMYEGGELVIASPHIIRERLQDPDNHVQSWWLP